MRIKHLLTISIFALLIQTSAVAQVDSLFSVLKGEWDLVMEDSSPKFSDDVMKTVKERVKERPFGNHNRALYNFYEDGGFHLVSLKDYSASNEKGIFELDDAGKKMTRYVNMPRTFKMRDRRKIKKKVSTILYLCSDYIVLREDGSTKYLHKISSGKR